MTDRLRVRREKSAKSAASPGDSEPTTTPETAASASDCQSTPCTGTPCDMLPVRKVRFVTPPSSPEESTTDDELIYSTTVSPIAPIADLPLATLHAPDALPSLDDQSAGGLLPVAPQPLDGNALGLSLGPAYEHTVAACPGLYVLPAMDTWEEICENLSCALEVCAVLADLDRSLPGSMSAVYYESETCPAIDFTCGSSRLWNCRVFPSMLF